MQPIGPEIAFLLYDLNGKRPFSYTTEYGNRYTVINIEGIKYTKLISAKELSNLMEHGYVKVAEEVE